MTDNPAPEWTDVHTHLADHPDASVALARATAAGVRVIDSTVLPSEYQRSRRIRPEG